MHTITYALKNETRAEIENLVCILRACEINEVTDSEDSYSDDYNEVTESLKGLAKLACTIDVRDTLLSIIDRMSRELVGLDEDYYCSIQSLKDDSDLIHKDLGFLKQAKKITKKIYKVCKIIMLVIELLEKLEEAITN